MKRFYKKKRVLVTGNTGFKGTWLCKSLLQMGADVMGYSLYPPTDPSVFSILQLQKDMLWKEGDVRDLGLMQAVFNEFQPEIVLHLAAQPIVREAYRNPVHTYETNIMGTVNICECIRNTDCVRSFVNVTTDKVYENENCTKPFKEDMPLDGHDPYSNSKSCSELVTHSYTKSFFGDKEVAVSTARAGNVIGGGDFAKDRIIPDCVRAATSQQDIILRNPHSVRPYQHVLEPLYAYLMIAMEQYQNPDKQGCYNVGPDDDGCITTGELADLFCKYWGDNLKWVNQYDGGPYEAGFLKLDCGKLKNVFCWQPKWDVEQAVEKTVEWYKAYYNHEDIEAIMNRQIGAMFDV